MKGDSPSIEMGQNVKTISAILLAASILAAPGCGVRTGRSSKAETSSRKAGTAAATARAPSTDAGAVTTTDYTLRGTVRSVSPDTGRVLIAHREIPGFMKAMTMPFEPANESILGLLRPGDEVEGILHVERQDGAVRDYQLRDLKVVSPAPPKSVTVDTSRGKFEVRQPPPILKIGEEVPDFSLTGQDGRTFKVSDLRGKVVVLTFIYTRCPMPDFCPYMDRKFSDLAQRIGAFPDRARDVRLISVSFDPENDTPEVLRKHAAIRGGTPPLWSYAVASHEELARVAPRLGLFFGPDGKEIAHNLCTAVIDPKGKLARLEVGRQPNRWETADFLKTVYGLLPRDGK